MPTDDERREVARRLRNVEMHAIPDARIADNPMTVEFIAAAIFYDLPYVRGLFSRLADLIEPDGKGIESEAFKPVESDGINRDALLALANELERVPDPLCCECPLLEGYDDTQPVTHWLRRFALRIREACGEAGE